jgi:uncharacterized protein (DUF1015 family)
VTEFAFNPADILIPQAVDMTKWSVIACDQFSSEREYWERVKVFVGNSPSTLEMIVPEAYLGEVQTGQSAQIIGRAMDGYLKQGIFKTLEASFIYVERTISDGRVRRGLIGMLDLEAYDYSPGSKAAVRASENTIVSRLPARIEVRRNAALELPHIMALIDDRLQTVIEPLAFKTDKLEKVYDFTLMEGGGHVKGWRVADGDAADIQSALERLFDKHEVHIIIGDGNHSLAAAKGYWDEIKQGLGAAERAAHPARYALVELNNVYDPAITFEAIHRVVFQTQPELLIAELEKSLPHGSEAGYELRWISASDGGTFKVRASCIGEMIGILQTALDELTARFGGSIDYIHGEGSVRKLSEGRDCIGFLLPAMDKSDFFATVSAGGMFPKKSFSIGHARDKRYYLECRRIKNGK